MSRVEGLGPEPLPSAPPSIAVRVGIALHLELRKLAYRIMPPFLLGFEVASGVATTMLLGGVAKLGVADVLRQGPLSAEELAERTGANGDALHRAMRALASKGIFKLRKDGRFENNRFSRAMTSGNLGRVKEWAEYFSAPSTVLAWLDVDETLRTGKSAFERVHKRTVWDYFDANPEERARFHECMMAATAIEAPLIASLYPFHEVTSVCDVGGGRGTLLSELLIRHPHLQGILCDGEGAIAESRQLFEARGVGARVRGVVGSFFDAVPPGADAYVLKNVMHDWDDARSRRILAVCRQAMEPGKRLLVVESPLERAETGMAAIADAHMMVVASEGRERSTGDYRALLEQSGFRLNRVFPFPNLSVLEGIAI